MVERDDATGREQEIDRIVRRFYEAIERGERIETQAFIREHPGFEQELRSFLADVDRLQRAADDPRTANVVTGNSPTVSVTNPEGIPPGARVEYIGEYRIIKEIARGGMGIVFKARQENLKRTVALKMILAGKLASNSDVERFYREARAAASLKHANIVSVYEIGIHEGHHYFTMDYIEGPSLAEKLREGSLAAHEAAGLIEVLARAIHYAHQKGVLHRDLKPANVLLDAAGQPHVTDFGLAKPLVEFTQETMDEITQSGQILGTPSYMAPEQAAAKHQLVSVASDVYSLGAVLYACLSGRAPFVAESTVETLRQVLESEPLPLRVLNSRIGRDLEAIAHKCLSKEPKYRYATAEDLATDLKRYQCQQPVVAKPLSNARRIARWYKQNMVFLVPLNAAVMYSALIAWTASAAIGMLLSNDAVDSKILLALALSALCVSLPGFFFVRAAFRGKRYGYWGNAVLFLMLFATLLPDTPRDFWSLPSLEFTTFVETRLINSGRAAMVFWPMVMLVSVGIQLHGVILEGRQDRRTRSTVSSKDPSDLAR